ncbi:glycosyltransferase [Sinorhizobium prairiense]|uniref:glycosyltransferase n=1 Tax=unclassified Sinorhizobium TaxID=2613772 RepID=UPI0023D89369|nr:MULTISPECIES: glycosyltransferase [unclassified Sinorhizobium]WEJ08534.1 glycosyltransferase [Sinorhizobium sp. M103]WEJ13964.1 glycosyltransferase [Sinorhizobium sp. K101]WEJ35566.1 glycosyltransferase [Sinorhizobium sp. C101]
MHILMFGKMPPIQGGVSKATWVAATDLVTAGHTVTFISNSNSMGYGFRQMASASSIEAKVARFAGKLVIRQVKTVPRLSYIPWASPYLSQLLGNAIAAAKSRAPDLVIGWYLEPYGVAASIFGRLADTQVVLRHAGSDLGRLRKVADLTPLYDHCLATASRVVASENQDAVQILLDAGVRRESLVQARGRRLDDSFWDPTRFDFEVLVEEAEAFFSNYGFERDFLTMLTDWNREGLRCSDPIVGSYGKIGPAKGTYRLIDALDLLAGRNIPVAYRALWSAAPNRFVQVFKHLASKKRLRGRTIILPPLPPWEVPAFIRSCSVITFLENNFPITFHEPQVPREVLACGTSLVLSGDICSKVSFAAELVDRTNVLRVEDPNDVAELASLLELVITDRQIRASLSHQGKALSRAIESTALPHDPLIDVIRSM